MAYIDENGRIQGITDPRDNPGAESAIRMIRMIEELAGERPRGYSPHMPPGHEDYEDYGSAWRAPAPRFSFHEADNPCPRPFPRTRVLFRNIRIAIIEAFDWLVNP